MASCGVTVLPVNPEIPRQCLCGDPADFVIETSWFRGRLSRDPVCEPHLQTVVGSIKAKLAERNGG